MKPDWSPVKDIEEEEKQGLDSAGQPNEAR